MLFEDVNDKYSVTEIIDDFDSGLALFVLDRKVPAASASPICLPKFDKRDINTEDDPCFFAGYEKNGVFKQIDVPVIDSSNCMVPADIVDEIICIGANLCAISDPGAYLTCVGDDRRLVLRGISAPSKTLFNCQVVSTHVKIASNLGFIAENVV